MSVEAIRTGVRNRKRVTIGGNGLGTFAEALMVPQLAIACHDSSLFKGDPYYGLKGLRLVSKAVKEVSQRVLHSYTLLLETKTPEGMCKEVRFLKAIHLLRLKILFPRTEMTDAHDINAAHIQQSAQLSNYITQLSPEMARVTHLHLVLPYACGPYANEAEDSMTALMLPLASSFPCLVQLAVSGRIGSSFFDAFGSLCPHLTSLKAALSNLSSSTLQQLPALLPHLVSLSVLSAVVPGEDHIGCFEENEEDEKADNILSNAAACVALKACPKLRSYDTTLYNMTAEVWAALPKGILSCTTAGVDDQHAAQPSPVLTWKQHSALTTLIKTGPLFWISDLAQLLTAAPNLSTVIAERSKCFVLSMGLSNSQHVGLDVVNAHLKAGLQVQSRYAEGRFLSSPLPAPVILHFFCTNSSNMSVFFAHNMPASPFFTSLKVCGWGAINIADVSHFQPIFPNLQDVNFSGMVLDDSKMRGLAACQSLQSVELKCCKGVTCDGIAALCAASRTLKRIVCVGCKGMSARDRRVMQRKGWWGSIQVVVVA